VPDWQHERRQSDIYLVSAQRGLASTRRLTFTNDKNETDPHWSRDGSVIAFLSDRDAVTPAAGGGRAGGAAAAGGGGNNQLYMMRLDGGEARKLSDAAGGVSH